MWPMYRLWLNERIQLSEVPRLSIDDIDLANDALTAWQDAERRAHEKATK